MKPNELRQLAAQRRKDAECLLAKMQAAGDIDKGEEDRYSALVDDAEKLLGQAVSAEQREARLNGLAEKFAEGNRGRQSEPILPHNDGRNVGTRHEYSLVKAIEELSSSSKGKLSGLEAETNDEIAKAVKRPAKGFYIPQDIAVDMRRANSFARRNAEALVRDVGRERFALDTTYGVGSLSTVTAPTIIEVLRAVPLLAQLGMQVFADLQGTFVLPRETAGSTTYWVPEGTEVTETQPTIGDVTFTPKTIGCVSTFSRMFLRQTSVDAESYLRRHVTIALGVGVDKAGFAGSGVGAEPEGLVNNSAITVVALGANGDVPTWSALVDLESSIANENALLGMPSFVTTSKGRGKMKRTTKIASSTFADWLWDRDNTVNGYRAEATNQLPSDLVKGSGTGLSAAILGNFAECSMGLWGGMDVIVDRLTGAKSGSVKIVVLQDADFQVNREQAFALIRDMVTV